MAASHKASLVGKDAAAEARQKAAVSSAVAVQQEIMETQPSERVVTSHKECVVGKDAAPEARKAKAEVEDGEGVKDGAGDEDSDGGDNAEDEEDDEN